ncbi:MAG: shikimate dehydrogenase, partial [Phycisphaerae bacterium]|nr:shikimate dehydrogenase [Phycisphaerae bacterium]
TMRNLYRWDAINGQTQVFGVIGDPVGHSLSPHVMNAGFDATGFNGVYLPLPIPPEYEHFKATVGAWLDCGPLHFRGASVTIPHKQNLLRFVSESGGEVEPLAERIGAANTLTVRPDGSLLASNTDYAAALDAIAGALGTGRADLQGLSAAVIGAGGAARALVAGLATCGARVVIHNRTAERAQALAEELDEDGRVTAAPLADLAESDARVFVNCTSLGMHPDVEATPMPVLPPSLGAGTVVFDTVYNPAETRWLREAGAAGATAVSGIEMFVRQAAAQFELWTGESAPRDRFAQIVRQRLAEEPE